jgi:hypothetical protein
MAESIDARRFKRGKGAVYLVIMMVKNFPRCNPAIPFAASSVYGARNDFTGTH